RVRMNTCKLPSQLFLSSTKWQENISRLLKHVCVRLITSTVFLFLELNWVRIMMMVKAVQGFTRGYTGGKLCALYSRVQIQLFPKPNLELEFLEIGIITLL